MSKYAWQILTLSRPGMQGGVPRKAGTLTRKPQHVDSVECARCGGAGMDRNSPHSVLGLQRERAQKNAAAGDHLCLLPREGTAPRDRDNLSGVLWPLVTFPSGSL